MPITYKKQYENGLTIAVWELTEPSDELLTKVVLTDDEVLTCNSFKLETRKREWLGSRLLIQHFLGPHNTVEYSPTGRPSLTNGVAQIGMTHTKGFAAIAIHPTRAVAIDIEHPSTRILKVSDRFLNDDERKISHPFTDELFQTIIWCSKEALFKWSHETEIIFKDHLLITTDKLPSNQEFSIDAQINKDGQSTNLPLHCCITNEYILVYTL